MDYLRRQVIEVLKRQRNDHSTGFWAERKLIDYVGPARAAELLAPADRREQLELADNKFGEAKFSEHNCDTLVQQLTDLIARREAGYSRTRLFEVLWFDPKLGVSKCKHHLKRLRPVSYQPMQTWNKEIYTNYDENDDSLTYKSRQYTVHDMFDFGLDIEHEPYNVWVGAAMK